VSIIGSFPSSWKTDVTVIRGGGSDPMGNPLPTEEIPVTGCLPAPRATSDPVDRSDLTSATAVLYHENFDFQSTDRIRFPDTAVLRGTWAVDGEPQRWPVGIEVPLRKDP
jgi:hypothetical protein